MEAGDVELVALLEDARGRHRAEGRRLPGVLALVLDASYTPAAIVFVLAAATDWLDGRLARRWGVTTRLGAFLDTTADKLLVSTALIALVVRAPRFAVGGAGHHRAGVHDPRAARRGRIRRAAV